MMDESTQIEKEIAQEQLKTATQDLKEKAKEAGAAAWDATRATYKQIQSKAVDYSRATDQAIRTSPYVALGFAFCVGMLLGAFATRPKIVKQQS